MFLDFMMKIFHENAHRDAVIWNDTPYSYEWLAGTVNQWIKRLKAKEIGTGTVVVLDGDFSPNGVSLFLALMERGCTIVPLTDSVRVKRDEFIEISRAQISIMVDRTDAVMTNALPFTGEHPVYQQLKDTGHPGLVLFSSGSTGKSKAAVHDLVPLLEKFKVRRHRRRALTFLLYDHIGGVNTMLYQLSNGGCIITTQTRDPDSVLSAVEKHHVELLPTSPTFLNLILLSEAYKRHDLSTLNIISYGTEPMPEGTLQRIHEILPNAQLLQTYGLSELGILRSKSKNSESLWMKVGGEGFETRVVGERLQIRAESAMLGYLNADNPFTDDGWFDTGDLVEVDGEFIKILGRESEVINVGGEKVHPAEIESIIQEMKTVAEAVVYGEKNPILGNIVCARVRLTEKIDDKTFRQILKRHVGERLPRYKVPMKIMIGEEPQHGDRFKKMRTKVNGNVNAIDGDPICKKY